MTSHKAEKFFYVLLIIIAIAACAGMVLLISQAQSAELAMFELLAFGVSITAVTLAALGAINNIQQARTMRRIAREMREAVAELRDIDKDNEAIKRTLRQDYTLARDIADALAEAGVIDDDEERHAVAGKIEQKVRTKIKRR